jgi:hypothetical protein
MDEDVTQHLDALTALGARMAAAVLTAALLMALVVVATGCAVVIAVDVPARDKPVATVQPPAGSTTPDGDSKNAKISIPAKRSER